MTKEERHAILTPAEVADARAQADRAIRTVGIPPELIAQLRPILAPPLNASRQSESSVSGRPEQGTRHDDSRTPHRAQSYGPSAGQ
ncbi:hypothetical protein [Streptomyces sp. NPDC096132]|uniref:hypothetical protein n=1 Tax=Streptomyces sp. NPDC096132 TaxID=3366075 RepID=UPI003825119B